MKAVQINSYGGVEVLEIAENVPKPSVSKGQVLVEVHAAGINPVDIAIRAGYLAKMAPVQFPATMGGDFAGEVKGLGEGVVDFNVGDEIFGQAIILNGGSGTFAEEAAVNIGNTVPKPKTASFEEAAALPLVGASAVQALEEHMKLQKGQKILIHGGAGGIGHIAIQLAKSLGAYVATTVSNEDIDFVKKLDADEVIDFKTQPFETLLKDYDAVFDLVGGEVTIKSFSVIKHGGVLVSMLGKPDEELAKEKGITVIGQATNTSTGHLKRLAELVDSGKIKVHIDKVFPLSEVKAAFRHMEQGHPRGKVVLVI